MPRLPRLIPFALTTVLVTAALQAQTTPRPASPGAADRFPLVSGSCPTFSWGFLPDAQRLELAVFAVTREDSATTPAATSAPVPILQVRLDGSTTSWTPSLESCLESGTRYGWALRTATADSAGPWSAPRFFETSTIPSADELAAALEVVNRYLNQGDQPLAGGPVAPPPSAPPIGGPDTPVVSPPDSGATLAGALAALRGELSDTTGETVGVLGISNSPNGAGLLAANTDASGADLVLDGSAQGTGDTAMTQSALQVGGATFDIGNGTDDLDLTLDGVSLVTTATDQDTTYSAGNQLELNGTTFDVVETGLDADTLDGMDSTDFADGTHDHYGQTWNGSGVWGLKVTSSSVDGRGVRGMSTATSGDTSGVDGYSASTTGRGLSGFATAATGINYGVFGSSWSSSGRGVFGDATSTTGTTFGVLGESLSSDGRGVFGLATSATGSTFGVRGDVYSENGRGVSGFSTSTSGTTYGVYGEAASSDARAVFGDATATSGSTFGVRGDAHSTAGRGVTGVSFATSGAAHGVWGRSASPTGYGGYFSSNAAGGLASGVGGGLFALGASGEQPDLVVGANDGSSLGEDGRIWSDPAYSGSDLILEANDSIVVNLDRDDNSSNSYFGVRNAAAAFPFVVREDGTVQVNGSDVVTSATDQNTTYSPGDGLSLTTTTFSVDSTVARKDAASGNQSFDGGTLYLDYTNNRIGIGTTGPLQALDIVGDVRVTGHYHFATPKNADLFLGPEEFTPDNPANFPYTSLGFMYPASTSNQIATAAVHLPNEVDIDSVSCYFWDNSAGTDLEGFDFDLRARNITSTSGGALATATSNPGARQSTTMGSLSDSSVSGTGDDPTSNGSYNYYLTVGMDIAGPVDTNVRFYGCRIQYFVSYLRP